jgi:hypothetical protein
MNEDEAVEILACIAANGNDRRIIRAVLEAVIIDAMSEVRPVVRWIRATAPAVEPPEPPEAPEPDDDEPEAVIEPLAPVEPVVATNGHVPNTKIGSTMAQAIRTRYWGADPHPSFNGLAKEFKTTPQTVTHIVKRKSYSDGVMVRGEPGFEDDEAAREARIQMRRERAIEGLPR